MNDPQVADSDDADDEIAASSQPSQRSPLGSYLLLLLMCLGLLAATILGVTFPRPLVNEVETASPPPQVTTAPQPKPMVKLPSVAVGATAEQFQAEAEKVAHALRGRFPDSDRALNVVALMNSQLRRTEEAEKLWQRCIELDPQQVGYYVNLAAIAMDRGNSELAVTTLQQALDAGCVSPDVYHHLAVALTNLGRCKEAVDLIRAAQHTYPNLPAHWIVLGQAQLKLGNVAAAETSLKKALSLGSQSADVYFALANACARLDKQDEAATYRKQFTQLKTKRALDPQQRFQLLSAQEARGAAVTILCESAAVFGGQAETLEAERLYLRAIALDPFNPQSNGALAKLYYDAGMHVEELVVRRRMVEVEPYRFSSYLNLAKVYEQLGEPESVVATLKLAISIGPDAAVGYATLAQFYLQSGKAKQARWYAQEAVRREPTAEGFVFLASTCRLLGNEVDAEAAMARARQLKADK